MFTSAPGFAVNILASNQRELSNQFARAGEDKFAGVNWRTGPAGSPLLNGVVSWFDCELFQQVEAGDHIILIGRVAHYEYNTHSPLAFCRGSYINSGVSPKTLQILSSPGRLRVGAIIESDGRILLEQDAYSGRLSLPTSHSIGSADEMDSLMGELAAIGIEVDLPFTYSAWVEGDTRFVYYLGELRSRPDIPRSSNLRFYDFDLITWEAINDDAVISMLQRYVQEKQYDNFSIYIGDPQQGETHPV